MSGTIVMFVAFFLLLFLGMPIAISIGISTAIALMMTDIPFSFLSHIAFSALDSFVFLAIPLFIMAGYVMEVGGLSQRIVDFASSPCRPDNGRLIGGHGSGLHVLCGSISGSSPATVAAIGAMMIPSMIRRGYGAEFSGGPHSLRGIVGYHDPALHSDDHLRHQC